MAKDSGGKTATCTENFEVQVRRCSSSNLRMSNGNATCTLGNIHGSECTYTCDSGYQLSGGTSSSRCDDNGSWTSSPSCTKVSCGTPGSVINGSWVCPSHLYGATCYLKCIVSGYKATGSSTIACQANKKWTSPGSCVDMMPPIIECKKSIRVYAGPQKSPVNVSWPMPEVWDNSKDKVSITSAPPSGSAFDPYSQDTKVVFTAKDITGNENKCTVLVDVLVRKCNASLIAPDFASISCSHHNIYGSVCTVSCNQGYQLEGDATSTCQHDGAWSGIRSHCIPRQCPPLPTPAHGRFDCSRGQAYQDTCALICDKGYKSKTPLTITCNINIKWTQPGTCVDVEAPQFPSGCPPDMEYPAARLGESTYVTYSLPYVTDNSGTGISVIGGEPNSGSVFSLGATNVTITARDLAGNMAKCQFIVTVRSVSCDVPDLERYKKLLLYDCVDHFVYGSTCDLSCLDGNPVQGPSTIRCDRATKSDPLKWTWQGNVLPSCQSAVCPELRKPRNGAMLCGSLNGDAGVQCLLLCNKNFMYPSSAPDVYNCFKKDNEWSHGGFVPDCIEKRRPHAVGVMPRFYFIGSSCRVDNAEIERKFVAALGASTFKDVCSSSQKCSVDDVKISCSEKSKVKSGHAVLQVSVEIDLGSYENNGTDSEMRSYYGKVVNSINTALMVEAETGHFMVPEAGEFDGYGYGSPDYKCNPGELFNIAHLHCAGCGKGYHYHNTTHSCVPCPRGRYQDQEISFLCTPCPSGMTTKDIRTISADQCVEMCEPGEVSPSGIKPCLPCERGSYQSKFGMSSCDICPFGMSTESVGSSSSLQCTVYNIHLSKEMNHPKIDIALRDPITSLTWMMWVHPVSSRRDLTLTFSLVTHNKTQDAFFSIGDLQLAVKPLTTGPLESIRKWIHIAILYDGGTITLFVNGKEAAQLRNTQVSRLQSDMFSFTPSDNTNSIVVSGVQMLTSAITNEQIKEFSSSCVKIADANVLIVNKVDTNLVTPSTCDDVDDCVKYACGDHGKCVDGHSQFTCICDDPWSGDRCETVPDFCIGNECTLNSTCSNLPEERSYTCSCPAGYKGTFCLDKIVNGKWSSWEEWGVCSVTCGSGERIRTRECNNPLPGPDGKYCPGDGIELKHCMKDPCPVDGHWGDWSAWTCQVSCGNGQAVRTRQCDNPPPRHSGQTCYGPQRSYSKCNVDECPVAGQFGTWSDWSQCSVTCGSGMSRRRRLCDSPPPSHGGADCNSSQAEETRLCTTQPCPVCKELVPREGYKSINCDLDEMTAMINCNITCKTGYMILSEDVNEFTCGRFTNYTWSHQTPDNPTGILPPCTDSRLPSSVRTVINTDYGNIDCNNPPSTTELKNSVNNNLEQTISCKGSGDCTYDIKATLSCGKRKRSTGSAVVVVTMEIKNPDRQTEYFSGLSEEEIEAGMKRAYLIEEMTIKLMNQSENIFHVSVGGVKYRGEVTGGRVELQCQDGSGMMNGVCVDCAAGSYSAGNGSCLLCKKGLYQDQTRTTSCLACPEGLTTSGMGSASKNDCQADPPDYMDLFAWTFNEEEEINATTVSTETEKDGSGEMILVLIVICVTVILALLLTVIAVFVGRYKRQQHQPPDNPNPLGPTYNNELFEARIPFSSSDDKPLHIEDSEEEGSHLYDYIGEDPGKLHDKPMD